MRLSLTLLMLAAPLALGADPAAPPPKPIAVKLTATPVKPIPCQPCLIDCDAKTPPLWRVPGVDPKQYIVRGNALFLTIPSAEPVTVLAYTTAGDQVVETVLVLTPDKPPPPPIPPAPADPLVLELRSLVGPITPAVASDFKALSALYTLMIAESAKAEYANAAALNAVYRASVDALQFKTPMGGVRSRLARDIQTAMPVDPDSAFVPSDRTAIAAVYGRLSKACDEAAR